MVLGASLRSWIDLVSSNAFSTTKKYQYTVKATNKRLAFMSSIIVRVYFNIKKGLPNQTI